MRVLRKVISVSKDLFLRFSYPSLRRAFNVDSHMTFMERVVLYKLSKGCERIAEIGSYVGASACCFGVSAQGSDNVKIICIDTWNNDAMTEGNRDTWVEFKKNTNHIEPYIIPVRGYSTDVVERIRDLTSSLDLLFIDGDHSYEGVKADWDAYKYFLRPNSIIVFHDYGWAEGVKRVVHEEVMPLSSSYGSLPNMWWAILA